MHEKQNNIKCHIFIFHTLCSTGILDMTLKGVSYTYLQNKQKVLAGDLISLFARWNISGFLELQQLEVAADVRNCHSAVLYESSFAFSYRSAKLAHNNTVMQECKKVTDCEIVLSPLFK